MCNYEKFFCVICNKIVNEECKYILNHNSDKFMYSLSYTPQKLKKKNIGTKFVHRICTTDIPNWDLLFLVVKPVFRLSFWRQIFQGNHRGQRLNLNNSSLKEWSHNKSSFPWNVTYKQECQKYFYHRHKQSKSKNVRTKEDKTINAACLWTIAINSFAPKILFVPVILLTVCHSIRLMFLGRIWFWIH